MGNFKGEGGVPSLRGFKRMPSLMFILRFHRNFQVPCSCWSNQMFSQLARRFVVVRWPSGTVPYGPSMPPASVLRHKEALKNSCALTLWRTVYRRFNSSVCGSISSVAASRDFLFTHVHGRWVWRFIGGWRCSQWTHCGCAWRGVPVYPPNLKKRVEQSNRI
jgi:hypothetical protein